MLSLKKISVLTLLCLLSSPAWSDKVNFCKIKKIYDEKDITMPPRIIYEDCSGEAYLGSIGKDFVKASCWAGASDLLEGKCEGHEDAAENVDSEMQDEQMEWN